MTRSIQWFIVVGAMAALTHFIAAVSLETLDMMHAKFANVVGFMVAFPVSYLGHYFFSFAKQIRPSHKKALPRFFLIALTGFIGNESLILLGLQYTQLPFWLLLALVMIIMAVSTYLLSKYWAFMRVTHDG